MVITIIEKGTSWQKAFCKARREKNATWIGYVILASDYVVHTQASPDDVIWHLCVVMDLLFLVPNNLLIRIIDLDKKIKINKHLVTLSKICLKLCQIQMLIQEVNKKD